MTDDFRKATAGVYGKRARPGARMAAGMPVRAAANMAGDVFTLSVANHGDPIPPEVVERMFQPFTRGATTHGQ